jgi:hypothetical protein
VPELSRLRHQQELQAVEAVGVVAEVGPHHLGGLALGLARLLEQRGLLALQPVGQLRRALLGLRGLLLHLLERRLDAVVLDQPDHLLGGRLRRLRESQHLGDLLVQHRQLSHVIPPSSI